MIHYEQILTRLRQQSLFRELRSIDEIRGPVVKVGDRAVVKQSIDMASEQALPAW